MIYDYKIDYLNGEETLCLYFDFSLEFAKLNTKNKKKKLKDIIKNYIKTQKINFNGKKIAILSGGLLIATLIFKAPLEEKFSPFQNEISYPQAVIVLEDDTSKLEQLVIEKREESKNSFVNNVPDKVDASQNKSYEKSSNKISKVEENKITNTPDTTPTEEVKNQILVEIHRRNGSILNISLEDYVIGVVGAEMPASFHIEALKSQAIIARTYALKALEKNQTLTDDSSTQNYKSIEDLKAMWGTSFTTYYNKIKKAVSKTQNLYLTYQNTTIEAVYHSTSNGSTEDAKYVWGNSFPYLVPASSPYDNSNKSFLHVTKIDYETISNKLGIAISMNSDIQILSKTSGNRVEHIKVDNNTFTGVSIRNSLGLRSADFDIEKDEEGIIFTTRGYGHGVGLSQYGANGLAKNGANYETILKHYYKDVEISKL